MANATIESILRRLLGKTYSTTDTVYLGFTKPVKQPYVEVGYLDRMERRYLTALPDTAWYIAEEIVLSESLAEAKSKGHTVRHIYYKNGDAYTSTVAIYEKVGVGYWRKKQKE